MTPWSFVHTYVYTYAPHVHILMCLPSSRRLVVIPRAVLIDGGNRMKTWRQRALAFTSSRARSTSPKRRKTTPLPSPRCAVSHRPRRRPFGRLFARADRESPSTRTGAVVGCKVWTIRIPDTVAPSRRAVRNFLFCLRVLWNNFFPLFDWAASSTLPVLDPYWRTTSVLPPSKVLNHCCKRFLNRRAC